MNINRLDLNLLRVLRVLNDSRSTTAAAERLHVSQPAISHALKRLRDTFDDPLFERRGRTLVPTARAERLLASVDPVLDQLDAGLAAFDRFDPATSEQRVVIGLNNAFENVLLPPLLARLAQEAPSMRWVGQGSPRQNLVDDLTAGTLDLAIDARVHLNDQIEHQRLMRCGYVVLGRRDHPLLAQPLTLDEYLAARHLLVTRRSDGPGLEDDWLLRGGHKRQVAIRCQSLWTACQVVKETDYLVTMPRLFVSQALQLHDFALADFPGGGLGLDVFLYWHRSRTADPSSVWLRRVVCELFQETDDAPG